MLYLFDDERDYFIPYGAVKKKLVRRAGSPDPFAAGEDRALQKNWRWVSTGSWG